MKKRLIKIFKSFFIICMVNSNSINLRLNAEQTTSNSLSTVQKSSKKDSIEEPESKDNNAENSVVINGIRYIKDSCIPLMEKLVNKNPNEWDSYKKEALDILNVESLIRLDKALKWIGKDNFKKDNNAENSVVISGIRYIKNSCIPLMEKLVNKNPNEWDSYKKEALDILNVESLIRLDKALKWIGKDNFKEEPITDAEYNDRSIKFARDICDLIIDLVKTDPSNWNKYKERKQKLGNDFLFIKKHSNTERKRIFKMILNWVVNLSAGSFNENIFSSIFPEDKTYVYYTVKEGDTLSKIALEHNTTVEYIALMNNIKDVDLIYPGQVFKI